MKFAHPEFLYALLVLMIPILIHLFNFRKYKTLYFSSLQFLKQVTQQTKSTQKLKHFLVLLSRISAFIALIIAFAQPYWPNASSSAPHIAAVQAIYIDNSFSMEARGSSGNLLSEAKESARQIIRNAPLGSRFMIVTNELSGLEQQIISQKEALDRIDYIDFFTHPKAMSKPLNAIQASLSRELHSFSTQYILLSDFQKSTFELGEVNVDSAGTYYPIILAPQDEENIFIDSIWFDQPLRKLNSPNNLNVRIQNQSPSDLSNLELRLKVDSYERQTLVDVPANGTITAQFNYTDKSPGWKSCQVEVSDKQLYFDDAFYFSYLVKGVSNVLIIREENSSNNPEKVFETDGFFNVKTVLVTQLQQSDVAEADVILVNGINSFPSGLITLLEGAVDNQSSLLIIPGESVNINEYNYALTTFDLPIITQKASQSLRLRTINYEDIFFQGVFDRKPDKINLPAVPIIYGNSATSRSNYIPLVQFENNNPLLVRHGGNKNVYMLYTGLQEQFGKLAEHILFSTVVLRAAEMSGSGNELFLSFGTNASAYAKRPSGYQGALSVRNSETEFIPPANTRKNVDLLSFDQLDVGVSISAGNCSIYAGDEFVRSIAFNYDRDESNSTYFDASEITAVLDDLGITNYAMSEVNSIADIEQLTLEKPKEYWRILLFLALAFLALEMLLTTFWKV